jgi:hypothetical protein
MPRIGLAQVKIEEGAVAPATMEGGATSPSTTLLSDVPHLITPDNETSRRRDCFGLASVDKWLYFLNEFVHPNLVMAFSGISFGQVSTVASLIYASLTKPRKCSKHCLMLVRGLHEKSSFSEKSPQLKGVTPFLLQLNSSLT